MSRHIVGAVLVVVYLGAIVAANLLVVWFGPGMSVVNAFLFIGLDITSRDYLHEKWHDSHLVLKMASLVAAGSLLSYALNRSAGKIALASFVAFTVAAVVDTVMYEFARRRGVSRMRRINESNIAAAVADSVLFPTIAFSTFLPLVIGGQFVAKVWGGAVWAWILGRFHVDTCR